MKGPPALCEKATAATNVVESPDLRGGLAMLVHEKQLDAIPMQELAATLGVSLPRRLHEGFA